MAVTASVPSRLTGLASATRPAPADVSRPMRLSVLGATGSIGTSTLDLVARNPGRFEIVAVTAQSNAGELATIARKHKAKLAVIGDESRLSELKDALDGSGIRAAGGAEALVEAALEPADCVMAAIVGAAGLRPTFAAASQGARVALANKECLVSAGHVFTAAVARSGAELLPVDSEHSAAFQAMAGADPSAIEKIVLTASGGPFRTWTYEQIQAATPEQALKHPNWSMGAKITIDSASLMNKGLELIEAFHLFPISVDALDCIVHPQSIVHCLVSYVDGSVLAQMAAPDMRTPIAVALAWPERMVAPTEKLDLARLATLTFEPPDEARFPALRVAKAAMRRGDTAPAVLNAANEIAVKAFLDRRIKFLDIAALVEETLDAAERQGAICPAETLDDILAVDELARYLSEDKLSGY
ncbi:MAG: 1-deoxy-D-xylulose-5-phosphate reductoisomerase [Hyphomicrobium sp.]|nr:MAG: 1-deoxy-D-xylulose-5-phosphate reductoisomerase [Hyphomicrobium sp.]